jgi:hypothetical protein
MRKLTCLGIALLCFAAHSFGQVDSAALHLAAFPDRIFNKINKKASIIDGALSRQTEKYLARLARKERKIQEHLYQLDSNAARRIFSGVQGKYADLKNTTDSVTGKGGGQLTGEYMPYTDSAKNLLAYAQKNTNLLNPSPKIQAEIASSLTQFNKLQSNFANADQVKEYLRRRKQMLRDQLQQYVNNSVVKKYLDQYNSEVYYYSQQVREYKEALNDPDKMLQKALVILNKIPAFTRFVQQNGQLAGLFGISGNYGSPAGVVGLQTRDQVQQLLQGQISGGGAGGLSAFQSSLESAHEGLDNFKDKLSSLGGGSGDIEMPDFKPNNEKTKSFLKRLELGTNLQTTRTTYLFPTTTDIGLSIGYKINNRSTIGIGGSYKIGWGSGINHIAVTSQGAGIRSFLDYKIKGTFYLSGGFEYNYQQPFSGFRQIQSLSDWSQSGLMGFSKMVSLPGKIVKKTKVQILWDFLSYSQHPQTQPLVFRVGYNF